MKKVIAPIIITILVLAVLIFYLSVTILISSQVTGLLNSAFLIGIIIILVIIMLTMVYVLFQRIKEIKEEDEDDISKY